MAQMLNVRLYRIAWIVAIVGILLVLLTLQTPTTAPEPVVPSAINGVAVANVTSELEATAPTRAPGSAGDQAAAAWVRQQFLDISGSRNPVMSAASVGEQEFVARWRGRLVQGTNVYISLPGTLTGSSQLPAIVIAAPRDAPPGVTSDASATGMLVALAQLSANTTHQRPLIFASLDDSTVGNAGMRWFLPKVLGVHVGAVVNVDAPDEAVGNAVWVWSDGRDSAQALGLDLMARTAISRAGGTAAPHPGVVTQLLRLAVPQSFGDQAPPIASGVPAVTIAGRPDTPAYGATASNDNHLAVVGDSVLGLAGSLDVTTRIPGPGQSVFVVGRELTTTALRILLFLTILPVLAVAVDAVVRLRRARIVWGLGAVALGWRILPWVAAGLAATMLGRAGLMPGMSAGAVPLPGDAPVLLRSVVALAAVVVIALVISFLSASRIARLAVIPASDVAVSLAGLAVMLGVVWTMRPVMLVLVIPAAHAAVIALTATRRRQLVPLVVVGVAPALVLCWSVADQLNRGVIYAAWYLIVTTAQGGRGAVGPVCALVLLGCACSVVLVADHRLRHVPQIPRPPVWDLVTSTVRNLRTDR
jgi:hypothetical protein